MEIKKQVYKGIEFTIHLACEGEWPKNSEWIDKFYTQSTCSIVDTNPSNALEDTENAAKEQIDDFVAKTPKTIAELVEELKKCLCWLDYGVCELDEQCATILINTFLANQKGD